MSRCEFLTTTRRTDGGNLRYNQLNVCVVCYVQHFILQFSLLALVSRVRSWKSFTNFSFFLQRLGCFFIQNEYNTKPSFPLLESFLNITGVENIAKILGIFSVCAPQYVMVPQLQSTCHFKINHFVKILHVLLGGAINLEGGGGA